MTDDQVRVAIMVLKAYAYEELRLDNDILAELDKAIAAAYDAMMGPDYDYYDEEPITGVPPEEVWL